MPPVRYEIHIHDIFHGTWRVHGDTTYEDKDFCIRTAENLKGDTNRGIAVVEYTPRIIWPE